MVFADKTFKTFPDPVTTTGIGSIRAGTYFFDGNTSYASLHGGLDQTTRCSVVVTSNTIAIDFIDSLGNSVGTFQGNSSDLPPGSKYNGDGDANWVTFRNHDDYPRFTNNSDTNATITVAVGNKLNFALIFADKTFKTYPDPVTTTGIGSIKTGTYSFSGTTSYASLQGGLDQTTQCNVVIMSNTVTISFQDSVGNPVGTFQGNSSDLPPGSKYSGDGSANWVASKGRNDHEGLGNNSDTTATIIIEVGNKLNYALVFADKKFKTSPDPAATTGIGSIKVGTYKFAGTTSYASLQGGLDQTTICNVAVTSNTVTINFQDSAGNPVGTFQGNANLPPGSKYSGNGSVNWVTACQYTIFISIL